MSDERLKEDNEPIRLVDAARREAWQRKPPKRSKAQQEAIIAEARKRSGVRREGPEGTPEVEESQR